MVRKNVQRLERGEQVRLVLLDSVDERSGEFWELR
jgi:hypothetical protein